MLIQTIAYLFPGINFEHECVIENDGSGPVLRHWNRPEPQPTQAEIQAAAPAAQAAADASEADATLYQTERTDLQSQIDAATARLIQIRDAASPTNAQVVAAVRDLAGYQLRILRYVRKL